MCYVYTRGAYMEKLLIAMALGIPMIIVIAVYVAIAIADLIL
jgi:hypothetical protein